MVVDEKLADMFFVLDERSGLDMCFTRFDMCVDLFESWPNFPQDLRWLDAPGRGKGPPGI